MVRALEHEKRAIKKWKSFSAKVLLEITGHNKQQVHNHIPSDQSGGVLVDGNNNNNKMQSEKSQGANRSSSETQQQNAKNKPDKSSDVEMLKERFAKLLLGEDMSGGGKGVSSALALSNAITNLAASVFGEQWRLEPMSAERKARWRKEVDWLLSVTDHIVEFIPSQQKSKDGTNMEIMVTRQRTDLHMNIPALRKLDAMLIDYLDNFKDQNEFWYVSRDADDAEKRNDDKWWLPTPKVPPEGLSDVSRKWLQFQKDSVNQVLKAAMAINAQVLSEMEVPENYIESLPKNGRASLGDSIYRSITVDYFDPEQFLSTIDLSTEHKILDLKNRIEASIIIWKRKMIHKDNKSSWGSAVSLEKRELFEERAESILVLLKQRFPGIPQSSLDISKIQYNRDVGQSILESYSRVLESLAYTVTSRIEDVLYADSLTQNPSLANSARRLSMDLTPSAPGLVKFPDPEEEIEKLNSMETPSSMTLLDFMGWHVDQSENENQPKKNESKGNLMEFLKEEDDKLCMSKPTNIVTTKKVSYLENLGGLRSPTARH
ncbi:PRONE domain [Macleaya cordata]|uniref:PRONE domain n=1 Tax=Macleaya cordata TaxID=56857 RepID=A0A200RCD8_MACCD|nr:PRONE domain [Macleaya cordata]